jgi:hypothetical protein
MEEAASVIAQLPDYDSGIRLVAPEEAASVIAHSSMGPRPGLPDHRICATAWMVTAEWP